MRAASVGALALVIVMLAGCTPQDPYAAAAKQTLADLAGLEGDKLEDEVLRISAEAEAEMWKLSGIDGDAVVAALQPASTWVSGEQQADFQLASFTAGGGLGMAIGMGFIGIGELGNTAVTQTNGGKNGSGSTELPGGQASISVGEDGGVHVEMTTEGADGALSVKVTAASDINPCPDADGRLELSADVSIRVDKAGTGMSLEMHVDSTGLLDDDANLVGTNYEYRQQFASYSGGKGEFLDHSGNASGDLSANRYSEGTTAKFTTAAVEAAAALAYMTAKNLQDAAEVGWSSGRCVEVQVTPSAGPDGLETDSRLTIDVAPRGKYDGQPSGGNIVATLSGQGDLDPTGSQVRAPGDFDYRAASEKNQSGTATFVSRSKRGIGTASVTLSTGSKSYTASGGKVEYSGSGLICSLTDSFMISGNTIDISFVPAGADGGSWHASGGLDDLVFTGDGSYTVVYADDQVATKLVLTGTVTTIAPDGSRYDGPGDLEFALTEDGICD